jgi:hypothetical protein
MENKEKESRNLPCFHGLELQQPDQVDGAAAAKAEVGAAAWVMVWSGFSLPFFV